MCVRCFEKKNISSYKAWDINDDFSCFGKGVEEKRQTCLTKFSQAQAIFRVNITSTATGTEGQIIPWALCLQFPVQPPSKLPAEMMVWGCLCPAVMSLWLQPPCWESAAAWLPAMPGVSVSGQDCVRQPLWRGCGGGSCTVLSGSGCTEVSSDQNV